MKKRLITAFIVIMLALGTALAAGAAPAPQGLKNFKVLNTYTTGQLRDVQNYSWYAMYVQAGYEYGILYGKTSDTFSPDDPMMYAEAVKTAACMHRIYSTGRADFASSRIWYKPYIDYALKRGIIDAPAPDAGAYITKAQYADMIARALPGAYPEINQIADNAIPDVSVSDSFGASVYLLYRAGVLTGCDSYGTFNPFETLTRAEAAAIIARAADTGFRQRFSLPAELRGEDIFKMCAPAVFYLERFDSEGVLLGIGSGFFITRDGLALTNYHVIDGASSAVITTADGRKYDVKGICGYDTLHDIAVLQIDGGGFPYLRLGDSSKIQTGDDVYAIGSPFGLLNTISNGVISHTAREVNGTDFIQYTAPISMGSGGGPVLNTKGEVVGLSCLTVLNAQTLNFAVPINKQAMLSRTGCVPLVTIVAANSDVTIYYRGYFPVPDYGIFTGTPIYKTNTDPVTKVKTYYYRQSDITVPEEKAVGGYIELLRENGFSWQSSYTGADGSMVDVYFNGNLDISVHFGTDSIDGAACRFVAIH
jgi:S1-C subfamily serine protease